MKMKERKICNCKRAYEDPLSKICDLCWNEEYPNEKYEIREENLLEHLQGRLEEKAEIDLSNKQPTIFHDTETQERVVQVRNDETGDWYIRVFFMEKKGKFLCWQYAETIEDAKKETLITSWNFMRELTEKRKLTMQEIADKFELDVEQIEII